MMTHDELTRLELLAEVDSLLADLDAWATRAPNWNTARQCQAIVRRLVERADTLRVRLDAPLVVATLGGTGTGKSTLVNALVGAEVTPAGKSRPTTRQPALICRPDITPELLGIEPTDVHLVQRDLPALRDLVIIDCPDPDTTEDDTAEGTNLARLRHLLPHCDVLLITSTQQKYRSGRVLEELAAAATGARLVFVQTHADVDADVRNDWRDVLAAEYQTGDIFFVDSLSALEDAREGVQPRGDFGRLVELLTCQLTGIAASRIRRANFLDLVDQTLSLCNQRIDDAIAAVDQLESGIAEQRARLSARLASKMREELLASRRQWEGRLLSEVAARWGFSPFSLVLRTYQGIGTLLSGAALFRMRTPAQMALWGAFEGARTWKRRRARKQAESAPSRAAAWCWDESDLRTAAIIVDGYAIEAGVPREETQTAAVVNQAGEVSTQFVESASAELSGLISRLAARHTGWLTRLRYEVLFLAMLGLLLFRLGKNFFYDSWFAAEPVEVYGLNFFVAAGFWLFLWCAILLWFFSGRLRRGLKGQIDDLAGHWATPPTIAGLFVDTEANCRAIHAFRQEGQHLADEVETLKSRIVQAEPGLGQRIG